MDIQQLSSALTHQNPKTRRAAASVIGIVEETRLLQELRHQYEQEPDENAQKMMMWAGKRVFNANQRGYNTIDEVFHFFGIDRELANRQTQEEERILRQMNEQLKNELLQRENSARNKQVGLSAGASMLGGAVMPGAVGSGADVASSNLGPVREQISRERIPAPRPSNADVTIWIRRLQGDPDPEVRKGCAREIASQNNITALPFLVANYFTEPEQHVKAAIEQYSKILYWNSVYWNMSQDGTLEEEMDIRLTAMMAATSFVDAPKQKLPQTGPFAKTGPLAQTGMLKGTGSLAGEEDLGEMLRRVEEKKKAAAAKKSSRKRK